MYGSVHLHVRKMRMVREVIFASVLQHEYAVGSKQVSIKNQIRYLSEVLQLIWRICKYEIKLSAAAGDVLEYVSFNGQTFVGLYSVHHFADKGMMGGVFLNAHHM